MHRILGRFVITFPVATILYSLLVLMTHVNFDIRWLMFALALDIVDWIMADIT